MTQEELEFLILANGKPAVKAIDAVDKKTKQLGKTTKKTSAMMTQGWAKLGLSIAAVTVIIKKSIDAHGIQLKAEIALTNAIRLNALEGENTIEMWKEYAAALQATTIQGDETTLSQLAMLKTMKLTDKMAKQIVETALDMATALGVDSTSAIRMLTQTLSGQIGTIKRAIPSIGDYTEAQLKSGEAIAEVSELMKGQAKAIADTNWGKAQQKLNDFGDSVEELGKVVLTAAEKGGVFDALTAAISRLNKIIGGGSTAITAAIALFTAYAIIVSTTVAKHIKLTIANGKQTQTIKTLYRSFSKLGKLMKTGIVVSGIVGALQLLDRAMKTTIGINDGLTNSIKATQNLMRENTEAMGLKRLNDLLEKRVKLEKDLAAITGVSWFATQRKKSLTEALLVISVQVKKLQESTRSVEKALTEELQEVAVPRELSKLEEFGEGWKEAMQEAKAQTTDWVDTGKKAANSLADALTDMALGAKDSFKDMARSIIADLARVAVKKTIVAGISTVTGFLGFHTGTTEVKHTGGTIGGASIPTFHSGSSGIASDERLAKLQVGEAVINRTGASRNPQAIEAMNRGMPIGGGDSTVVHVTYSPQVNALDPRTAAVVIAENAPTVVSIVKQAFNKTGQQVNI